MNNDAEIVSSDDDTNRHQQNGDELFAYFLHKAPPAALLAKQRLEKLLPALVTARRNGHKIKALVADLAEHGIETSHVTLRKKLDAYELAHPEAAASPYNVGDDAGEQGLT